MLQGKLFDCQKHAVRSLNNVLYHEGHTLYNNWYLV